jgi:rfaE bifunctional protein kinase chain/domain
MTNNYNRKIKTKEEILEIIGQRPRDKKVIMCHGTFDLVHPGHIRHLMYAKGKADILIASLTGDAFITKADYRPFVPEELRAMNLAALEVVDYVLTDYNHLANETIRFLQPDFFAKGYEYLSNQNVNTIEEMDILSVYGGEMVFTPGDVVYSSSAIINSSPPNLSNEKLATLMDANNITFIDLKSILKQFKNLKVFVLGDTIVDTHIYCNPISNSMSKTPTISLAYNYEENFVGGAAIVAKHIKSAGAEVEFCTTLGHDELGTKFITSDLWENGIKALSISINKATTNKKVYIANKYRMLKVDIVDNMSISEHTLKIFSDKIRSSNADAFIFSDFRHGIFNRDTIPILTNSLPTKPLRVADSQVASRWGNILEFKGFDLITPNEREARFALADQDSVIRPLAYELYKQANCKTLILKLGSKGILTYRAPSNASGSFFAIDSFADNIIDPVGAGDALLAYSTLTLALKESPIIASILGSMAAGIACETEGNNPVTPESVWSKLETIERTL